MLTSLKSLEKGVCVAAGGRNVFVVESKLILISVAVACYTLSRKKKEMIGGAGKVLGDNFYMSM